MGAIRLGPFLLERPIARGGMAEVWRGVHAGEQMPVAIKVLTGPHAREEAFVRALKNEIHAVARLDHPGIIVLYDRGEVSADAARASGGRLVQGSPWFAMEMCSHGALSPRRFPLPWKTTRMLLLSLLDALAHAHARGVVHRDLKPGNVLLCAPDDPRPGLKLSDFGIAQPLSGLGGDLDAALVGDAHSGTPRYMAPEQFNGRAREIGPWTDLYALGCIAFQLGTGEPPFAGDPLRLAVAHCHDPVPTLTPKDPGFPPGFEAWVLRLLEKDPADRFRAAADAAWALLQLTPDDEDTAVSGDWEDALRSLKPRPLFPDEEPSEKATTAADDTEAHTLGPHRSIVEHPSMDATPAPPPGHEESTGPLKGRAPLATVGEPTTGQPTAVGRRNVRASTTHGAVETAPTGHAPGDGASSRAPVSPRAATATRAGPVIPDDDPFAAVLAVGSEDADADGADPVTDPRTWAPQAPWTELLALHDELVRKGGDTHPTIAGPFDRGERSPDARAPLRKVRAPAVPPPVPPSWRRPDEATLEQLSPRTRRLLGAALGLFGLRQPPFVDRIAERDALWRLVRRAHGGVLDRDPTEPLDAVAVVRGPAGIGRTRLCAWVAERAAEVGAAVSLVSRHGVDGGPLDGVVGALLRHARAVGLCGDALRAAIGAAWPALDAEDAAQLARVFERPGTVPPAETRALFLRTLVATAVDRAVVVVLDDAQWGEDAVAFAEIVARSGAQRARHRRHGIVVVLAVADEALAEHPRTAEAVHGLCGIDGVVTIALTPLPGRDHRRLVEDLLGLEARLAELVATRTAGNPRFAVEIVGDLIERGVLELGPAGFALKRGARVELPDDVHATWAGRLTRLLATLPPEARVCLELGAVLGSDGGEREWADVCVEAGLHDVGGLIAAVVDALERARFVVVERGGLRFAHAMLRESMARLAREEGRLESHHRVIAEVLARRPHETAEQRERRARHLLAAGDLDAAVPLFLDAAAATLKRHGAERASVVIDEVFAALDRHGVVDVDPRRLRAMALRARVLTEAGRYAEGAMWARLVDDRAPPVARLGAARALALGALLQGDLHGAVDRYAALLSSAEGLLADPWLTPDDRSAVEDALDDALQGLADGHYYRGQLFDAAVVLSRCLQRAQERDDDGAVALCLWSMSFVALWRGELAIARDLLLRQQKIARRAGLRTLAALGRNALGDVERVIGRTREARAHYAEAERQLSQCGSGKVRTVELNRALCDLRDDVDGAVARIERLLLDVERAGERGLVALCHGVLAVGAARDGDWSAVDAHLAALALPHQQGIVDGEAALIAEEVARRALHAGETWRAGVVSALAREIWEALGRPDRLETLPA